MGGQSTVVQIRGVYHRGAFLGVLLLWLYNQLYLQLGAGTVFTDTMLPPSRTMRAGVLPMAMLNRYGSKEQNRRSNIGSLWAKAICSGLGITTFSI